MDTEIPVPLAAPVEYEFVEEKKEQPEPSSLSHGEKGEGAERTVSRSRKPKETWLQPQSWIKRSERPLRRERLGGNKEKVFSVFFFVLSNIL